MKISIVTISFNQAQFIRQCVDSVFLQNYNEIEYIIVDPGSTDGSREIIESYGDRIIKVFDKDKGPADGLNKGFSHATGEVLCYLNSDDKFLPGAIKAVAEKFSNSKGVDVLLGHGYIIDEDSNFCRRVYSDSFSIKAAAYGASLAIQPSTFFRREIYNAAGGFNVDNKSNWDGELLIDMALAGANIIILDEFLSCYRIHSESITGSGRLAELHATHTKRMFNKIMGRECRDLDDLMSIYYRLRKHLKNPKATLERILHGPIFGTK